MISLHYDVVVLGGGIAGLWTLDRLLRRGYDAVLVEARALGGGQTLASQGIIHGGLKYALGLGGTARALRGMPERWRRCLAGQGEVDLRGARLAAESHCLWFPPGPAARLAALAAGRGRLAPVADGERPAPLAHPDCGGTLLRLAEPVVDVESVVRVLAGFWPDRLLHASAEQLHLERDGSGACRLVIAAAEGALRLAAGALVLCAGAGNGPLLAAAGARWPKPQLRPLHQVMVRHRAGSFHGHVVGIDGNPRLTVTSHPLPDGSLVWYLGGALAEAGVGRTPEAQIAAARAELAALMPWLSLGEARFATVRVERAEPRRPGLARPADAFACWVQGPSNVIAAWPTKLALAPRLAERVEALLGERNVRPSGRRSPRPPLPAPPLSTPPWREAFGHAA
ncbi:MAG: FAD-dependent oxidoreductase [Porticoccaceae bacterium]|nr:MAG: FAD-dependent oxidoreductase [Porticoccaceae bacterium]